MMLSFCLVTSSEAHAGLRGRVVVIFRVRLENILGLWRQDLICTPPDVATICALMSYIILMRMSGIVHFGYAFMAYLHLHCYRTPHSNPMLPIKAHNLILEKQTWKIPRTLFYFNGSKQGAAFDCDRTTRPKNIFIIQTLFLGGLSTHSQLKWDIYFEEAPVRSLLAPFLQYFSKIRENNIWQGCSTGLLAFSFYIFG